MSEHEHTQCMMGLIEDYRRAASEEQRSDIFNLMHEEVAHFDETMKGMTDEEYQQKDGDATATAIVNRWLINAGIKTE